MTDKEALLVALEALHYCEALNRDVDERKMQAITVIRKLWTEHAMREVQRLGQEIEQVPSSVQQAYGMAQVCLDLHDALGCKWGDNVYLAIDQLKAAAHTPQRKPLTYEQIAEVYAGIGGLDCYLNFYYSFALAIEAAHGIKENT